MVVIRLTRGGAKKRPFYHVVAADKRSPRDGRNLEIVGYFNPIATGGETRLQLDMNKINAWVSKGAQASDRVKSLMAEFNKTAKEEKAA
jgi:small subunit ribosomal protein S16